MFHLLFLCSYWIKSHELIGALEVYVHMQLIKYNLFNRNHLILLGFPGVSGVKNLPAIAGDLGLIPGPGRSAGEGDGSPLQYSCLENPIDKGAWQAKAHGVAKSWMWLSDWRTSPAPHGRHVAWWVFVCFAFCFGRHPVTCGILVPRPRMEPVPPALGVWSLNYKEIPLLGVLRFIVSVSLWVTA